jgi:hypothetical protein
LVCTIWSNGSALVAKVNLVDLRADRIVLSHEYLSTTPVSSGQTQLVVGGLRLDWRPTGRWGRWSVDAPTGRREFLRLKLSPRQPYVEHGREGIIRQGPAGRSAYYSGPRMAASGTVELAGRTLRMRGQGWFDDQWGDFGTDVAALRWNWFACQFRDGSDLMLYQFLSRRFRPTRYQNGTLVTRDGHVKHLVRFTVLPLRPRINPSGHWLRIRFVGASRFPPARSTSPCGPGLVISSSPTASCPASGRARRRSPAACRASALSSPPAKSTHDGQPIL